jgi:hypothetical protein
LYKGYSVRNGYTTKVQVRACKICGLRDWYRVVATSSLECRKVWRGEKALRDSSVGFGVGWGTACTEVHSASAAFGELMIGGMRVSVWRCYLDWPALSSTWHIVAVPCA